MLSKVSVILPCYNPNSEWVNSAIKSILNQTYKDLELILIDDGSINNLKTLIEPNLRDRRLHYFYQQNKGFSSAINLGIKKSSGDYIGFIGQDDIWLPMKLEWQLNYFSIHNNSHILYSDYYVMDSKGKIINLFSPKKYGSFSSKEDFIKNLFLFNFLGFETVLVKRRCFDDFDLLDEKMIGFSDHDMWLRLAKRYDMSYLNIVTVKKRAHKNQISLSKLDETMLDEFLLVKKALVTYPFLNKILNKKMANLYYYNATLTLYNNGDPLIAKERLLRTIKYQPWNIKAMSIYLLPKFYPFILKMYKRWFNKYS